MRTQPGLKYSKIWVKRGLSLNTDLVQGNSCINQEWMRKKGLKMDSKKSKNI